MVTETFVVTDLVGVADFVVEDFTIDVPEDDEPEEDVVINGMIGGIETGVEDEVAIGTDAVIGRVLEDSVTTTLDVVAIKSSLDVVVKSGSVLDASMGIGAF